MNFCKPFKKLCAIGLPSPWNEDAFIGSREFVMDITKEQDNNQHFQNEEGPLSGKKIAKFLIPYFHLLQVIVATLQTYGYPLYGLVTRIDVMYHRLKDMPNPIKRDWESFQHIKVAVKQATSVS